MPSVAEVLAQVRASRAAVQQRLNTPSPPPLPTGGNVIPVQWRRGGGGPTRLPGGAFGELTPAQEMLLFRYEQALRTIRELEPNSPGLQIMRDPNLPPREAEVLGVEAEATAARARARAGEPPRGSVPAKGHQTYVQFEDWDEPTPARNAVDAARYGRTLEDYEDLARDPAKSGAITNQGRSERRVGLEAERDGVLKGPIQRDLRRKGGEFIDADGQSWDVNSFRSVVPGTRGGFTVSASMETILDDLKNLENVVIDTRLLSSEHIQDLRHAVEQAGIAHRVRWWP